jgi:hypothetical protein
MQRVFHFRTDTISDLINVLATDHSDQSRVLLRLLKIILKCRNPEDILSKLSPNTDTPQPTTNTTSYAQTDEIKPEQTIENVETDEERISDTNLHTDHTVTVAELESAFESQSSNTHRDEHSISSIFHQYNYAIHNIY